MKLKDLEPGDLFVALPEDDYQREALAQVVFKLVRHTPSPGAGGPLASASVCEYYAIHDPEPPFWLRAAVGKPAYLQKDTPVLLYVESEGAE